MTINPDITQPLDLVGRRLGETPGAVIGMLFPAYAQAAGLDPRQVEVVPVNPPQMAPALVSGQVDAIGQFVVGLPLIEAAADGQQINVLPFADYLGDLYGVCLVTTKSLATRQPGLCRRFRDALLRGLSAALTDPGKAAHALAVHHPATNTDVAAAELRLLAPYARPTTPGAPLGVMQEVTVMHTIATLQAVGAVTNGGLEPDDLVAFDLLPQP